MAGPRRRSRQSGRLDPGPLGADIGSFWLHLAAEGKAARTVQGYTSAVRWFAAGYLLGQPGKTSWEQVDAPDIQRWMAQLLDRYSGAYASIQFRALRQFFKWLAAEEELPDPMARLRAPKVTVTAVPVFTSVELSELDKACQGRSFAARRDAAIIAVFTATGIRLAELAGIRYHPGDPARSDLDLQGREIQIRGKGGKPRTVKIGHQAARSLDRYLRARARHAQAHRPQLWLGVSNRGPLTAAGIYQIVARRGRQCGVNAYPHRFRHHFSHTWLDRGGAERDLMELNGWTSPQMLTRYGASARGARARRSYDRIMDDSTSPRP
jgi:site-specific recombinase XerD